MAGLRRTTVGLLLALTAALPAHTLAQARYAATLRYVRKATARQTFQASLAASRLPDVQWGTSYYLGPYEWRSLFQPRRTREGGTDVKRTYPGWDGREIGWKELHGQPRLAGKTDRVIAWVYRTVRSGAAQSLEVRFGGMTYLQVRLNGRLTFTSRPAKDPKATLDQVVKLPLQAGENHLLLRVGADAGQLRCEVRDSFQDEAGIRRALLERVRRDFPQDQLLDMLIEQEWVKRAHGGGDLRRQAQAALTLATDTLALVQREADRGDLAAELAKVREEYKRAEGHAGADWQAIFLRIRRLRRRIILSHPRLAFDRLLINKRPPTGYSHQCDQYLGRHSGPGPGLVVIDDWKTKPRERVLLEGKMPVGSVLHPDLSFDAKKILFSFCDHRERDRSRRRFFIWEIGSDGRGLRQLTGTAADPLAGRNGRETVLIEDFDPCYLPGGGFVFISTRNQGFGRCHGGRYTPSYVMYRADADGSNIRQISFGEANEWDPSILHDGRIVYTRWDYINRHDTVYQSLWVTKPDGTATAHYYGNYTRNPCMQAETRAIPDSRKTVFTATAHHGYTAGSIVMLDILKGEDGMEPLERITPEARFPETEGWPSCSYATPWPLSEDLYLAAYSPDRLVRQGSRQRTNAYAIYLVDTLGGRELIYFDPEMSCFAPIPLVPRDRPPVIPSPLPPNAPKTGVFFIQDIHACRVPVEPGTIKAVRINRIYAQPTAAVPPRSMANNEILKGVLGTVGVDAGGRVAFRAPAGVPLQLQALDADGLAVMTMRSQVYLQPGERISCVGCHEPRNAIPTGGAMHNVTVQDITPPAGGKYEGGLSFARTVQPVLDRYCIRCHGLKGKPAGGMNLLGTPTRFNKAYESLMGRKGLIALAQRNRETGYSKPKDYFGHAGRLIKHLKGPHADRVKLDRASFQRLADWLDLNAQYHGDYSHNRTQNGRTDSRAEKALRDMVRTRFGAELAGQPLAALVNICQPTESRILMAPLPMSAGGWGQTAHGAYASTKDPAYQQMLRAVQACVPRGTGEDLAGTCGHDRGCRCRSCWVRQLNAQLRRHATNTGGFRKR